MQLEILAGADIQATFGLDAQMPITDRDIAASRGNEKHNVPVAKTDKIAGPVNQEMELRLKACSLAGRNDAAIAQTACILALGTRGREYVATVGQGRSGRGGVERPHRYCPIARAVGVIERVGAGDGIVRTVTVGAIFGLFAGAKENFFAVGFCFVDHGLYTRSLVRPIAKRLFFRQAAGTPEILPTLLELLVNRLGARYRGQCCADRILHQANPYTSLLRCVLYARACLEKPGKRLQDQQISLAHSTPPAG